MTLAKSSKSAVLALGNPRSVRCRNMIWNEIHGWNGDAQDQVPMILPNFYRQIKHQRLTSRFCNTKTPEPTRLEPTNVLT